MMGAINPFLKNRRVTISKIPNSTKRQMVTLVDGHPGALEWLGSVRGHRVQALGVERGDAVAIPAGDAHRWRDASADAELLEVSLPARPSFRPVSGS